jgi:hypothetical protein
MTDVERTTDYPLSSNDWRTRVSGTLLEEVGALPRRAAVGSVREDTRAP